MRYHWWWLPLAAGACTSAEQGPLPIPSLQGQLSDRELRATWIERPVVAGVEPSWQLRAQRLRSYLGPEGLVLMDRAQEDPTWTVGLRLTAVGEPGRLTQVPPGAVSAADNRVEIRRPGVIEWVEARPEGLEQGFFLDHGGARTELELEVTGGAVIANADGLGASIHTGKSTVQWSDLVAWDADHARVPARVTASGGHTLRVTLDTELAEWPVTVDPMLVVSEGLPVVGQASSGYAVAIDGERYVTTAPEAPGTGEAYLYPRGSSGGQQFLDPSLPNFGASVALQGTTIALSSAAGNTDGIEVLTLNGLTGTWEVVANLGGVHATLSGFEFPVAMDRDILVAGLPAYVANTGLVSVWHRSLASSSPSSPLWDFLPTKSGVTGSQLGSSVDVDGAIVVAGAPGNGTVKVFLVNLETKALVLLNDVPAPSGVSGFGESVGVSGGWLAVGAPTSAKVVLYHEAAGSWTTVKQTLSAPFLSDGGFGNRVAIHGRHLAVTDNPAAGKQARVHLFEQIGSTWTYQDSLDVTTAVAGMDPLSVDLSEDLLVVGAPSEGTTRSWGLSPDTLVEDDFFDFGPLGTTVDPQYGSAVALDGDHAAVGVPGDDNVGVNAGSVELFVRDSAGNWKSDATLDGLGAGDKFGTTVGLVNREFLAVGAPFQQVGTTPHGAVDVYSYTNPAGYEAPPSFILEPTNAPAAVTEQLGAALAVSPTQILAGAPFYKNGGFFQAGHAELWVLEGGVWTSVGGFAEGAAAGDNMGNTVALVDSYYLVGSGKASASKGRMVFYRTNPTTGALEEVLDRTVADEFGHAVAFEGDLLVTESFTGGAAGSGELELWQLPRTVWNASGLTALGTLEYDGTPSWTGGGYGGHLALEGDLLFVGTPLGDEVEVRQRNLGGPDAWGLVERLTGDAGSRFGSSLAVDDGTLMVGEEDALTGKGGVHFYHWTALDVPPTARDDDFRSTVVLEDHVVAFPSSVLTNDTDPNGALTVTVATDPSIGTVDLDPTLGTFTYTPDLDAFGADGFDYTLSDGDNETTGHVDLTVTSVNDSPVGGDQSFEVAQGLGLTGDLLDDPVISDVESAVDQLTVALTTSSPLLTLDPQGPFTFSSAAADGYYVFKFRLYDPDGGFSPEYDLEFTVVHSPPAFHKHKLDLALDEDAIGWMESPGTLDPDVVTSQYPLEVVEKEPAVHGTMVFDPWGGGLLYYPDPDFVGLDSWVYQVDDGSGPSGDLVTVNITVSEVPDPPVARPDAVTGAEDQALVISYDALKANDLDTDTPLTSLDVSVEQPQNGTIIAGTDIRYTPNPDFTGTDTFVYELSDGSALNDPSSRATVTITVLPLNDPPNAENLTVDPVSGPVNGNLVVVDPEGDSWSTTLAVRPNLGTATVSSDGSFTYTPFPDAVGSDGFVYQATDSHGAYQKATVSLVLVPSETIGGSGGTTPTAPTACTPTQWYVDGDHDGFGNPDLFTTACEQPAGYADNASDCDDTRADVHVGAREIVDDQVDQDCDGIDNQVVLVGACSTGTGSPGLGGLAVGLALLLRRRGGAA